MTRNHDLEKLNIQETDKFDSGWVKRIVDLNEYRIQQEIPLADPVWLTILDVTDDLICEAVLLPEELTSPDYAAAIQDEIKNIFDVFAEDLTAAKERFMQSPSLLDPPR